MRIVALILAVVLLVGCAHAPTKQEEPRRDTNWQAVALTVGTLLVIAVIVSQIDSEEEHSR